MGAVVAAAVDMYAFVKRALHSNMVYTSMHVLTLCRPWVLAGLHAFNPRVLKAGIATHLEPSAAGSATTVPA